MKQILTVSCKLTVNPEQVANIEATMQAFSDACTWINQEVPDKVRNEIAMQSLVYHDVRARFGLSSQLAIHAIRRVCGNRKTAKTNGGKVESFSSTSVTYDVRTFSFREKDWTVSLTMVGKRERLSLDIGDFQRDKLSGQKLKTATLVRRDSDYYLNIQVESEPPTPEKTDKVLGVDLGRTDIAVTSEGESFSGKEVTRVRDHHAKLRQSIQRKASKGTRSTRRRARRLLQRLSGKERRFQKHQNHVISHRLVKQAKTNKQAIALEDLTGIRQRTNDLPRSKTERRRSNSWAFYQLRQFIEYKAIQHGVTVILVNPAYTSKTCHNCHHIHPLHGESYRSGKSFHCGHCGWKGDADLNGAKNIANIGAVINQPGGSGMACSLSDHLSGLLKTQPLYRVG